MSNTIKLPKDFKISGNIGNDINELLKKRKAIDYLPTETKEWFYLFGENVAYNVAPMFAGLGYAELLELNGLTDFENVTLYNVLRYLTVATTHKILTYEHFNKDKKKYLEYLRLQDIVMIELNDRYADLKKLLEPMYAVKQNVQEVKQAKHLTIGKATGQA